MIDGPLDMLIRQLAALPGLGTRSARRIALHLLTNKDKTMLPLAKNLSFVADSIQECNICGNLDEGEICRICKDANRDRSTLCVVSSVADLWAIERTGSYKGTYHILGGVLSALDGIGPDDLTLDSLLENVRQNNISELILALGATVEGQSTAHYITDQLDTAQDITITRLAHGLPVGGELDFLDDSTISTALKARAGMAG